MSGSIPKFAHVVQRVISNVLYRCQRCNQDFDLEGAVQHVVEMQWIAREEAS